MLAQQAAFPPTPPLPSACPFYFVFCASFSCRQHVCRAPPPPFMQGDFPAPFPALLLTQSLL